MKENTKVFCLNAKDEYELVKKMNEEFTKRKVFASTPIQKNNNEWCCFVYY